MRPYFYLLCFHYYKSSCSSKSSVYTRRDLESRSDGTLLNLVRFSVWVIIVENVTKDLLGEVLFIDDLGDFLEGLLAAWGVSVAYSTIFASEGLGNLALSIISTSIFGIFGSSS